MRWLIIWIAATNPDPLAVHVANTEERCRELVAALYEEHGGAYVCARYADTMTADHVEIWTSRDSSAEPPRVLRSMRDATERRQAAK